MIWELKSLQIAFSRVVVENFIKKIFFCTYARLFEIDLLLKFIFVVLISIE